MRFHRYKIIQKNSQSPNNQSLYTRLMYNIRKTSKYLQVFNDKFFNCVGNIIWPNKVG